jgi:hypothetical protein
VTSVLDNLHVECSLTTLPDDPAPVWVDITQWVDLAVGIQIQSHGRPDELASVQPTQCTIPLINDDARFTSDNVASPYYPNLKIRKKIRVYYDDGVNPRAYLFTGYVEEWPVEWPNASVNNSAAVVTAVDRFKRLGVVNSLRSVLEQEILADHPAAYYTLGEPSGSLTAGDTSKDVVNALITATQFGTGGAINFGAGTGPGNDGLSAAVFAPVDVLNGQFLSGQTPSSFDSPTGATLEAFINTPPGTKGTVVRIQSALDNYLEIALAFGDGSVMLKRNTNGGIFAISNSGIPSVSDGQTHHVAITADVTGGHIIIYVDGNAAATASGGLTPIAATSIMIGGASPGADYGCLNGTISHVAVFRSVLSAARILAHAQAGLTGFAGERSDQRIARIAGYIGIPTGEQSLDTGLSTSIASVPISGLAPLQAMQDVADTEGGLLFMAGDGTLTFQSRAHRYNAASVLTLVGDSIDPAARFVKNDAYLVNDATVSRPGGITFRAINQASINDHGPARITPTLLTTSDNEVVDAANWKVNEHAVPAQRLPAMIVDLLTNPTLIPSVLGLRLSDRITTAGLPTQAPASSLDMFVEGWAMTIGTSGWPVTFNLSPAGSSGVWQLDSSTYSVLDSTTRLAY